jgi:hypothetical protein
MYIIAARASGGNEDHMAGYFPPCDAHGTTPVAQQSTSKVHHLLGNIVSPLHNQLPGHL